MANHDRISSPAAIDLSRCIFFECTSGESEAGGAIFVHNFFGLRSSIMFTSFMQCTTQSQSGGAVYVLGCLSTYFCGCCFTQCASASHANAMILSSTDYNKLKIISVVSCYNQGFRDSYNTVEIQNYTTTISTFNSTDNRMTRQGSGIRLFSREITLGRMSYLTFLKNEGSSIIAAGAQLASGYVFTLSIGLNYVNFARNDFNGCIFHATRSAVDINNAIAVGNTALGQDRFETLVQSTMHISSSAFDKASTFVKQSTIGDYVHFFPDETPETVELAFIPENECHLHSAKQKRQSYALTILFSWLL